MKENMGQIIRRLRKEQNLTQEELAEQLNISAQAISKWESEINMPDISQVVPLANFFGVPTDILFGVYGKDTKKEIEKILAEINEIECKDGEEGATALVILNKYREALRLYPNNDSILTEAMAFSSMVLDNNRQQLYKIIGDSGLHDLENEIIKWANLVIKYSTSVGNILSAKERLIQSYLRSKNYDAALEITNDFPLYLHQNEMYQKASIYHAAGIDTEEKNTRGGLLAILLHDFAFQMYMLENIYMKHDQYSEALYCCETMHNILDSVYQSEKYRPPFMYDYRSLYQTHALCLIKLGRNDEAVEILDKGVDFIIAQEKDFNKKIELDIPVFPGTAFSYGFKGNAAYGKSIDKIQSLILNDAFSILNDLPSYQKLVDRVNCLKS